jgi:outer membrane protein OmpU
MKRLLATTALLAVLTTPVMADVTIGGDMEWSYQDNDGTASTAMDGDINFKASTTTDTGLTFGADINLDHTGSDDGGNSVTLSNDTWTLDLGDVNSALDAIDDTTDFTYVLGNGSPSTDHSSILSLSPIGGLTVNISNATGNDYGTTAGEGYAYSAVYGLSEIATLGAGQMKNADDSEEFLMNATAKVGAIGVAFEKHTATTAADVDTDTTTMGATYSVGAMMVGVETMKTESAGTVSSDEITLGAQYTLAPGAVAFIENTADDKTSSEKTTAMGIAIKF